MLSLGRCDKGLVASGGAAGGNRRMQEEDLAFFVVRRSSIFRFEACQTLSLRLSPRLAINSV